MTTRAAYAMTETQLMEQIRKLCKNLGLLAFHCYDSRRSWGPGFPDLIIVGPNGLLAAECKRMGEQLTPNQRTWRHALATAGIEYRLWRPDDYWAGRIEVDMVALT